MKIKLKGKVMFLLTVLGSIKNKCNGNKLEMKGK